MTVTLTILYLAHVAKLWFSRRVTIHDTHETVERRRFSDSPLAWPCENEPMRRSADVACGDRLNTICHDGLVCAVVCHDLSCVWSGVTRHQSKNGPERSNDVGLRLRARTNHQTFTGALSCCGDRVRACPSVLSCVPSGAFCAVISFIPHQPP